MKKEQEEILRSLNYNEMSFTELYKKLSMTEDELTSELRSLVDKGLIKEKSVKKRDEIAFYNITEEGKDTFKKEMEKHFENAEEP